MSHFLNICSQNTQHIQLKLQTLTGKHNVLRRVGRGFCFNKRYANKKTHNTDTGNGKKSVSDLKEFRAIWGHSCKASTKQAPSAEL